LPLTLAAGTNYGSASSLTGPHFPAVDGSGNVWISNKTSGVVAEFSSAGAVLSPGVGFAHNGISGGLGITIDPSGNVWIANNAAAGAANDPNSVFEIVGVASPTVTPLALQLKNSAVATKP
jgi:streptogramin lyase